MEYSTQIEYLLAANYTVEIPYNVDLNTDQTITVRAYNVDVPDGEELVVSVDTEKSGLTDGLFCLKTADNENSIECTISVMSGSGEDAVAVGSLAENDNVVAVFGAGDNTLMQFGSLYINPIKDTARRGHYFGNIYYTIEVKDYM
jgi:hypothetical protein